MLTRDLSIRIGGDAGQGIESVGGTLARALARRGLHVFATQDFRSRIRGGHNFYQVRASLEMVQAQRDPPDLLLAFTSETVDLHMDRLATGAGLIYDASLAVEEARLRWHGIHPMPVPLIKIAAEHGSRVMTSVAGLGALAGVVGLPLTGLNAVIRQEFAGKGPDVVATNLRSPARRTATWPARFPIRAGKPRAVTAGGGWCSTATTPSRSGPWPPGAASSPPIR